MTHTPGPWEVFGKRPLGVRAPGQRIVIAWTNEHQGYVTVPRKEVRDNGHLIAAAPELLEACKEAQKVLRQVEIVHGILMPMDTMITLKQVIAKAEGE